MAEVAGWSGRFETNGKRTNFDANSYANEMSSSCNVRSLDDSASANAMKL